MTLQRRGKQTEEKKPLTTKTSQLLVPTGSTLLNLACADNPFGGWGLGRMINLIGDSSSGKTLLTLSMFAEVCQDKRFDKYKLIFDDAEAALSFNIEYLFGKRVKERVEIKDLEDVSDTVQDLSGSLQKLCVDKTPFIYVIDSFDALSSEEEQEKDKVFMKKKKDRTDKELSGSMGMERAKMGRRTLRQICLNLKKTNSLLIIISQATVNVGWGFSDKTRAGGTALKFFATHEMWLSIVKRHKSLGRTIGINGKCKVSKNKLTGKEVPEVLIPIYYDYGIDDIGANIDYLLEQNFWKREVKKKDKKKEQKKKKGEEKEKGNIIVTEWDFKGSRNKLIDYIEQENKERELQVMVHEAWQIFEEKLKLGRKPRYT
jgi:RecA/RadA recombinase